MDNPDGLSNYCWSQTVSREHSLFKAIIQPKNQTKKLSDKKKICKSRRKRAYKILEREQRKENNG